MAVVFAINLAVDGICCRISVQLASPDRARTTRARSFRLRTCRDRTCARLLLSRVTFPRGLIAASTEADHLSEPWLAREHYCCQSPPPMGSSMLATSPARLRNVTVTVLCGAWKANPAVPQHLQPWTTGVTHEHVRFLWQHAIRSTELQRQTTEMPRILCTPRIHRVE